MANNKTKIDNETENEIDDMFKDKVSIDVKYDHYLCETCNKKYKSKSGFCNHMKKIHNIELRKPIYELMINIDNDKRKLEKKINESNPSPFRIPQHIFIKEGISEEKKKLLFENKIFKKIKPLHYETLYGFSTEDKKKIFNHLIQIDVDSKHTFLEHIIKIYTIIFLNPINLNCLLLEENGDFLFVKEKNNVVVMNIYDLIEKKLKILKQILSDFIKIEKENIEPNLYNNIKIEKFISHIAGNLNITCLYSSNYSNKYSRALTRAIHNIYLFYKFEEFQKYYSETIPLFYNYKILSRKDFYNPDLYDV